MISGEVTDKLLQFGSWENVSRPLILVVMQIGKMNKGTTNLVYQSGPRKILASCFDHGSISQPASLSGFNPRSPHNATLDEVLLLGAIPKGQQVF